MIPKLNKFAASNPVSIQLDAVVIRADGTREELGTIAYWHRNPLKRMWHSIKRHFSQDTYSFMRKDSK